MTPNLPAVPMDTLERMARAVADSKLFGIQNTDQAMALMLVAQAEGLHPATVARDYHIIQGRPALKADAMLARYLNSGGKVEWHAHTDDRVEATFTHPAGGSLKIEWDMKRAKQAGLGGKDMWSKYPRQMLRARVISEGIRATNPAIATGIYTPEEVQDMAPDTPAKRREKEKDITPEVTPLPPRGEPDADGVLDHDYAFSLDSCLTVQELADVWRSIPKSQQARYLAAKDARKAALSAATAPAQAAL